MRRLVLWTLVFGVVVLLLSIASAVRRASEAASPQAIATEQREELREIRSSLNACLTTQDRIELRFQGLAARTDSLRDELDDLEGLDPRGVPAELYPRYLELVDEFNASVMEWERQSEDLRAYEGRCRAMITVHNDRADSLQRYLVESGIWDESWTEVPGDWGLENEEGPPV